MLRQQPQREQKTELSTVWTVLPADAAVRPAVIKSAASAASLEGFQAVIKSAASAASLAAQKTVKK